MKQPINRLVMMRARGFFGPMFQQTAPGRFVKSVGNYVGLAKGLMVFPKTLSIQIAEGETNPQYLYFSIESKDDNGDQLAWTLAEAYTWLTLSSYGGTGRTTITITIDPTNVGFPGNTVATITAASAGADGSPSDITVTVEMVASGDALLMESGEFILTEDGDKILVE